MGGELFLLLRFAFQDFLADREFNNSSEANLKNHRTITADFIDYCLNQNVTNVEDITTEIIKQYFKACKKRGNNAGTINTRLIRILTSNKAPKEWGELLGNPAITTAILDRIMHRVEIIHLNGDSYRMKHRSTIFSNENVSN